MRSYRTVETPLGPMLLLANGHGLSGAWFVDQKYFPTIDIDWCEATDDALLNEAATQIKAYFSGKLQQFDLSLAAEGTAFQQSVWSAIAAVGYSERITYTELAQRAGRSNSVRAAGAATGRNPISLIVPCHRIVGTNGSLTGYAGGLDRKRQLLSLEATWAPSSRTFALNA